MRLGQFARKFDVPIQEIISYLQKKDPTLDSPHPNSGLTEETEALLIAEFDLNYIEIPEEEEKVLAEPEREPQVEIEPEPEVVVEEVMEEVESVIDKEEVIESIVETEETPAPIVVGVIEPVKEEKVIATDRLMELLESEEASAELDEITLIKAPKRELEGLKVVGKIDLPEPRVKSSERSDNPEKDQKSKKSTRQQRAELNEEERKKRVVIAKKKRAAAEAKKERQKQEREKREVRARKEAHYNKKVTPKKPNPNRPQRVQKVQKVLVDFSEEPKEFGSVLSRFWKWLNT